MKYIVKTDQAPAAIGPYSQGVSYKDLVFTSGQLAIDPTTSKLITAGISEQSQMALKNLQAVLKKSGAAPETVLKTTCYLADINDFSKFNEMYALVFKKDFPARSCFAVKDLPAGALVEIEAIAFKKTNL